jgi:hypothetical protein
MNSSLRNAPLLTASPPTPRRLSLAIFFNYVITSVINRRCSPVARKNEITTLFAKVRSADRRLSDWMRANHDDLLVELGSGRIVWRPVLQVIADLGLLDEHGKLYLSFPKTPSGLDSHRKAESSHHDG